MKTWQALTISFLYFALCLVGIQNHELWLDEAHHILLGRESNTIQQLIYNSRYEGHPLLGNLIIYSVIHLFHQVIYVQLFHIILSTASAYIILKHAPFSVMVKLFIVFGYFMLYEYAVISRHYALSLLFILLLLVQLSASKQNFISIAILLFLLCNVHVFSIMVAIGFMVILYHDWKTESKAIKITSALIVLTGFILCINHSIPPKDHFLYQYNQEDFLSLHRLSKTAWVPLKGLLPFPDFTQLHYWNTNLFISLNKGLGLVLSVLAFLLPGIIFLRSRKAFVFFYIPLIFILSFFCLTPLMLTNRNCGYISMILLAAFWIKQTIPPLQVYTSVFITDEFIKRVSQYFIPFVLIVQLLAGIIMYCFDMTRNFSNSKSAALYLNAYLKKNPSKVLLSHHSAGPAISVYLSQPLFYLESEKTGSFCEWNTFPFINSSSLLLQKIKYQMGFKEHIILILNEKAKMSELQRANVHLQIIENFRPQDLISFENATVGSENYFIYKLK